MIGGLSAAEPRETRKKHRLAVHSFSTAAGQKTPFSRRIIAVAGPREVP